MAINNSLYLKPTLTVVNMSFIGDLVWFYLSNVKHSPFTLWFLGKSFLHSSVLSNLCAHRERRL